MIFSINIKAQYNNIFENNPKSEDKNILNHMDLSFTAGTTGLGFDVALPIGRYLQVRAGATFMPHIKKTLHYGFSLDNDDLLKDPDIVVEEGEKKPSRFDKVAEMLSGLTGSEIDNIVSVDMHPTMNNFKLLCDVFPIKSKKFHVTAGFYAGSSIVGKASNIPEDMTKLIAISTYNNIYDKVLGGEYIFEFNGQGVDPFGPEMSEKITSWGRMSVKEGTFTHDIAATEDTYYKYDVIDMETGELLHEKGELIAAKGDVLYHKGEPYKIVPGENNMVKAVAKTWKVKPYIGVGYGTPLAKGSRTSISFDAGFMVWGGSPRVITHDGIDLVRDVQGLGKSIAGTVNFIKAFEVFPVLNIRLTHRIF